VAAVDVESEIEIAVPRRTVARFAADPDNAPAWYDNIESVEWETPPPLAVGSRVAFVAHFLGRRLSYTYEVVDLAKDRRLVMRSEAAPFPMETRYTWADAPGGGTRMRLRNVGEPRGFGKVSARLMARSMRRANRNDLAKLKHLLEHAAPADGP
jgi:uncharacterized membrane protein